jgi:hypothetical protein
VLLRFDFEITGAAGTLQISFRNLWRAVEGDGLPVDATAVLGEQPSTEKMSIVIEPVTPGSERYDTGRRQSRLIRFGMLFNPTREAAACDVTATVTQITALSRETGE